MIWNYDVKEIEKGYIEDPASYQCIICQEKFEQGRIYKEGEYLFDAKGAVQYHIKMQHGSVASYLLSHEPSIIGITEIQQNFLTLLLQGKSDQEIGEELGIAQSTVRNHRFKIREKEKQAKLFCGLMKSLEAQTNKTIEVSDTGTIEEIHITARMVDDRYNITDKERAKTIANYIDETTGALKQFPAKEKKKIIVLSEIMKNFKNEIAYTEKEVDKILKRIFQEDYPTLRRALIEYGFMERTRDCKTYRVKE